MDTKTKIGLVTFCAICLGIHAYAQLCPPSIPTFSITQILPIKSANPACIAKSFKPDAPEDKFASYPLSSNATTSVSYGATAGTTTSSGIYNGTVGPTTTTTL